MRIPLDSKIKNQSVYKAFKILECFSTDNLELTVTEISAMTGLYKSNVYNILSTLEELGYVLQDQDSKKYYLGNRFLIFSALVNNNNAFWKLLPETLQNIARETGEVAFFAIRKEDRVYYVNSAYPDGEQPLHARNMTGMSRPMYCTALGKVLLAFSDKQTVQSYLERTTLEKLTSNTITDPDAFLEELERVRKQKYAFDNMEQVYGTSCIAVPVFINKELEGAISISGSSMRFSFSDVIRLHSILVENVNRLQMML